MLCYTPVQWIDTAGLARVYGSTLCSGTFHLPIHHGTNKFVHAKRSDTRIWIQLLTNTWLLILTMSMLACSSSCCTSSLVLQFFLASSSSTVCSCSCLPSTAASDSRCFTASWGEGPSRINSAVMGACNLYIPTVCSLHYEDVAKWWNTALKFGA